DTTVDGFRSSERSHCLAQASKRVSFFVGLPAFRDSASGPRANCPSPEALCAHEICAKLHIRNAEPVALTAKLTVQPPATSSSMNRVSANSAEPALGGTRLRGAACFRE